MAVLHHEGEHFRRARGVGTQPRLADSVTDQAVQVLPAFPGAVSNPQGGLAMIAGNPGYAAGLAGGATVAGLLLHHQHTATELVRNHGPGHAGGATAGYQPVYLVIVLQPPPRASSS